MATIQEYSHLRVPENSSFSLTECSSDIPVSTILNPARLSVKWSAHLTGHEALPLADNMLSNLSKGSDLATWIAGDQNKSPLKEKEIFEVKGSLSSLWEKFSSSLFAQIIVRTILVANSYLDYLKIFKGSDPAPDTVSLWSLIVPAAQAYNGVQKFNEGAEKISKAENFAEIDQGIGTLISATADTLLGVAKVSAAYFLHQVSPTLELIFTTSSYLGSLLELVQDEETEQQEQIDQFVKRQPTIAIKV